MVVAGFCAAGAGEMTTGRVDGGSGRCGDSQPARARRSSAKARRRIVWFRSPCCNVRARARCAPCSIALMERTSRDRHARLVRVALAYNFFFLLAACASAPPPTDRIAAARAMVTQAQPLAEKDAPLELNTAKEKLARAEQAM